MVDVSFEIGGRTIRPNQIEDDFQRLILEDFANSICESLRGVKCAVHGEQPRIRCVGRRSDELNVEVSGCCEALITQATNKLP